MDFRYDESVDTYVCLSRKTLTATGILVNDAAARPTAGRADRLGPTCGLSF